MYTKKLELISDNIDEILPVVKIILEGNHIKSWSIFDKELKLYQHHTSNSIAFPYGLNAEEITMMIKLFLRNEKPKDNPIDIDGSSKVGYQITSDGIYQDVAITVKPTYTYYGK